DVAREQQPRSLAHRAHRLACKRTCAIRLQSRIRQDPLSLSSSPRSFHRLLYHVCEHARASAAQAATTSSVSLVARVQRSETRERSAGSDAFSFRSVDTVGVRNESASSSSVRAFFAGFESGGFPKGFG